MESDLRQTLGGQYTLKRLLLIYLSQILCTIYKIKTKKVNFAQGKLWLVPTQVVEYEYSVTVFLANRLTRCFPTDYTSSNG